MLLLVLSAFAADITPEDAATVADIRNLTVSPDGRVAVYTERRWDAETVSDTHLTLPTTYTV